ncbi:hypothetical protein OG225_26425 [Nocardia sp. NBC_01377]
MSKDERMSKARGQCSIRLDQRPEELAELAEWIRRDDNVCGVVTSPRPQIRDGRMGDLYEVSRVAVGSGGIAAALARSWATWLTHLRSDVTITATRADGASYEPGAKCVESEDGVVDIQKLLDSPDRL